ncbi:MAG TPA: hypothetical protein VGQ93_06780 [Lysobacter sp.]|nr:hypothetical protein [Lysobacter sp.]
MNSPTETLEPTAASLQQPNFPEALRFWLLLGCMSFLPAQLPVRADRGVMDRPHWSLAACQRDAVCDAGDRGGRLSGLARWRWPVAAIVLAAAAVGALA